MLRDLFSLFPAYAGVILGDGGRRSGKIAFPRIRGGDPKANTSIGDWNAFSPHMRG